MGTPFLARLCRSAFLGRLNCPYESCLMTQLHPHCLGEIFKILWGVRAKILPLIEPLVCKKSRRTPPSSSRSIWHGRDPWLESSADSEKGEVRDSALGTLGQLVRDEMRLGQPSIAEDPDDLVSTTQNILNLDVFLITLLSFDL